VGAAGAIGKRLTRALGERGDKVIASDRATFLPVNARKAAFDFMPKVDVCDTDSLRGIFKRHPDITTVWNLAAPLSIETELDPARAHAITVGGMQNILTAMTEHGVKKILFTDSIGSFGAESPRVNCTARWLCENPRQDPGSDYGLQKREIRNLMAKFAAEHGGDTRFAVLPGILHSEAIWGMGTTEYALEAMRAAAKGSMYSCPLDIDVTMPMLFVDDLLRGLMALQDAEAEDLKEPQAGYAIPGLSFSAEELFAEIRRKHYPDFRHEIDIDTNVNKFAKLWPASLSTHESLRDLGYAPQVSLEAMVDNVITAHHARNHRAQARFKAMDKDGDGLLEAAEVQEFLEEVLVLSDSSEHVRKEMCALMVKIATHDMDRDKDGRISMEGFEMWSRRNGFRSLVQQTTEHMQALLN
jgi:nucleoside-diphosphate-sugar epimerase